MHQQICWPCQAACLSNNDALFIELSDMEMLVIETLGTTWINDFMAIRSAASSGTFELHFC